MEINKKKIRKIIKTMGLTEVEFYKLHNWSRQYYSWLINSDPTLYKLERLAAALNTEPLKLLRK